MFEWVLNIPLILSSNVIWHPYGLILNDRFSGLLYILFDDYFLPPPILDTSPPQHVHSPLFLDNLLSFPHKPQNWIMKKVKCSQMLLVTKHEQTHQVAHTMIRDHKFYADLEYKPRCMDEPMGILKWWNLQHSSSKNKNFTANLNNNSFPHTFFPPLSNQIFTPLFVVKFKTGQGSMSFSMLFAWWSLSLLSLSQSKQVLAWHVPS